MGEVTKQMCRVPYRGDITELLEVGILLEAADIDMSMLVPSSIYGLKRMVMP